MKQTIITPPTEESKSEFPLQSIATRECVADLIKEFEPDLQFQAQGRLSLRGLYYIYQLCLTFAMNIQ